MFDFNKHTASLQAHSLELCTPAQLEGIYETLRAENLEKQHNNNGKKQKLETTNNNPSTRTFATLGTIVDVLPNPSSESESYIRGRIARVEKKSNASFEIDVSPLSHSHPSRTYL